MTEVTVFERNDPLVEFDLVIQGTGAPYILTGATVEMYLKQSASQADAAAVKKYSTVTGEIIITDPDGTTIPTRAGSKCTVQMDAATLGTPGSFFFHLDAIKSAKRETVASGMLIIVDI